MKITTIIVSKEEAIGKLLRDHGLKKTPIRIRILDCLMRKDYALSASDILAQLPTGQDKVTVYRALTSFEQHGIIHRASEDGQGIKYAVCSHHCPAEKHTEAHAHFTCDQCQNTYCLEEVKVPQVEVKGGFSIDRINYTLSGICIHCRA